MIIRTQTLLRSIRNTIAATSIAMITAPLAYAGSKTYLSYSGYMNGTAHFSSAYCSIFKGGVKDTLSISAPVYYKQKYQHGRFSGPRIFLLMQKDLLFCPNQYNMSHRNTFKTDSENELNKIKWHIKNDQLIVTFRNVQMYRLIPGIAAETPQHNKKYKISLNGTLYCTDDTQDTINFDNKFNQELENEH